MSVLIKDMKMPDCCDVCIFSDWSNLHQTAACKICEYDPCFDDFSRAYLSDRAGVCPLVEVKTPHGRLIDADKLFLPQEDMGSKMALSYASTVIDTEDS